MESSCRAGRPDGVARSETAKVLRDAEARLRDGRYADAIVSALQILENDPGHLGALETLARAQWKASALEPLLFTMARLLAVNPYEPGYHALRGAALQCLGRYGEAAKAFERAGRRPETDEGLRELHAWQAELLQEMSRTDPVLRTHLRQHAANACAARGFRAPEGSLQRWLSYRADRASTFQRPS